MNLFAWTQMMYLQSASNWLQVEADKESLESSVDMLTRQANDLDELLLSASGRYNPLPDKAMCLATDRIVHLS